MCSTNYYNDNAASFYERTINADVSDWYEKFLTYVKAPAKILDAGCGVGRDAKYFMSLGFDVSAFDGSLEMAKIASRVLKKDVRHLLFQDISYKNEFDAIWANASLLHVPFEELREVFEKLRLALKPGGILFASFNYGSGSRNKEKRTFYDFNEESILPQLSGLFEPLSIWKSRDTRNSQKAWLNILGQAH